MNTHRQYTSAVVLCAATVCMLIWGGIASAAQVDGNPAQINIPAGSLMVALEKLSDQSGVQIMYETTLAEGLSVAALSGKYTVRAALQRLLAHSGLSVYSANEKTVVLKRSNSAANMAPAQQMLLAARDDGKGRLGGKGDPKSVDSAQITVEDSRIGSEDANVDLPRSIDDAQPYYIFDAETIERSGALSTEDFLKQRLTMNTNYLSSGQSNQSNIGNISRVNLRGIGSDKTLILVNGRRQTGVSVLSGSYQPDLNGIPVSAIERIEVLPTSASAIYGGNAMGGVVNVVLKNDYSGGDVRFTYDNPMGTDAPARSVAMTYGTALEGGRTRLMAMAQYSDSSALRVQDRIGLLNRGMAIIERNSPGFFVSSSSGSFTGATPNIYGFGSLTLRDGTPLNSNVTHIPVGTSSATAEAELNAGLLANAGSFNMQPAATTQGPTGLMAPFGADLRTRSMRLSLRREMTSNIDLFVEYSRDKNHSSVVGVDPLYGRWYVSGAVPTNPFDQFVMVRFPSSSGVNGVVDNEQHSLTSGLAVRLSQGWKAELDYTRSKNNFDNLFPIIDYFAFPAAINSGEVNLFVDTQMHAPDLDQYYGQVSMASSATMNALALRASGPVARLPWGQSTVAVGLERRQAAAKDGRYTTELPLTPQASSTSLYLGQRYTTYSAYAELQMPLMAEQAARPLLRGLDLQLAVRSEHNVAHIGTPNASIDADGNITYGQPNVDGQPFSTAVRYKSTDPTVGVRYKPIRDLTVRASYGTAFLSPTNSQLLVNRTPSSYMPTIYDSQLDMSYPVQYISGGNPNLKPQSSISYNFGVIWSPQDGRLGGTRLNLEYYNIEQLDVIGSMSAQQLVDYESDHADRVVRDEITGMVTQVDTSYMNLTRRETAGLDLSLSIQRDTGMGQFLLTAQGTRILHERRQSSVNAPLFDYLGYVYDGGPGRFKGNVTLSWQRSNWVLGWAARYFSSYTQAGAPGGPNGNGYTYYTDAQGGFTIPSQIYHDLFVSIDWRNLAGTHGGMGAMLDGVDVQLGVKNVFDTPPPFDAVMSFYNYNSSFGDIRMRSFQISLRKEFH